MRQIVLDTETTGLEPSQGHRIIEIGAVELIERQLTGNNFHRYLNPQRDSDPGALAIHGITSQFLQDKPLFGDIYAEFINYIDGAELIIHNAAFDIGFLDHEFGLLNQSKQKIADFCKVLDTLSMARKRHPGQKNNLDALCKRYHVDNTKRNLHGALLDAEILASVYLVMTGGQANLFESNLAVERVETKVQQSIANRTVEQFNLNVIMASEEELVAHQAYLKILEQKSGVKLWEEAID